MFPVYRQVLWLGCPECFATWESASSLPTTLIEQFESETTAESTVESVPMYGHVSSIVTIAERSAEQPAGKKRRRERTNVDDTDGYTICSLC